jgi:transcription elongation factor Elf1
MSKSQRRKTRRKRLTERTVECLGCGTRLVIWARRAREPGHVKNLWCARCGATTVWVDLAPEAWTLEDGQGEES